MRGQTGAAKSFAPFDETPSGMPELRDAEDSPHPYLWFKREQLADLRKKFNEPMFANYRKLILKTADKPPEDIGQIGSPSHAAIINAYLWAYLLSEKPVYRAKLFDAVDALLVGTGKMPGLKHGRPGKMHLVIKVDEFMCHNAEAVASVYDTLFHECTPEQRTRMFRYLRRHVLYYLERIRKNDWWYRNNPSNTIAVGSGNNGIAALAIRDLAPEAAEAIDVAVKTIHERYMAIASDGSCIEGALYWDYGFTYQLLFGHALRNATGDDQGLLTGEKYKNIVRFAETQLGGDGRLFPFNDSQPWLTGMAVCADFGSRQDNALMRWLADKTAAEAVSENTPVFTRSQFFALAFRARDRQPVPDFPGVPTLAWLDELNWGVLRSNGTAFKPALVMGVKGRDGGMTHHTQEDMPGFTLQANGESFIIDPGYYQGKAANHSVPLVDGKGPDKRGRALIEDAWEHGDLRTMTVDATDAYKATGARCVRRIFALCRDHAAVILDDVDTDGEITAQYQCGFPVELAEDTRSAVIVGEQSRVHIRPLGRRLTLKMEGPVDFERSWVFKKTGVQWYQVRGTYPANPAQPLVTILQPMGETEPGRDVHLEWAEDSLVIEEAGKSIVTFERDDRGWALKKD